MPFSVPLDEAAKRFPQYTFVRALTPSEQKCAFHVMDQDGTDLCLKIVSPDYDVGRLGREVDAMLAINHPNVVEFIEYQFSYPKKGDSSHYLIENFIPGTDLSDHFTGKPWSLSGTFDFFRPLFDGLAELKKHSLVHRDLKPTNIRVHTDGYPVIIDFGLARHLARSDLTLTVQGAAIGTPLYFAPEQFTGTKHDIDCRTDLFAAGVLLYTAVVGEHPFGKPNVNLETAVCSSEDHKDHPTFKALPRPWQLLVGKLLEKDRANRPSDPSQVIQILDKIGAQK